MQDISRREGRKGSSIKSINQSIYKSMPFLSQGLSHPENPLHSYLLKVTTSPNPESHPIPQPSDRPRHKKPALHRFSSLLSPCRQFLQCGIPPLPSPIIRTDCLLTYLKEPSASCSVLSAQVPSHGYPGSARWSLGPSLNTVVSVIIEVE